jgi:uncharacterized protein with HEPN domain
VSRDALLYVADTIEACERVQRFTQDIGRVDLAAGSMVHDAVLRNLEVLGEAAKRVPVEIRALAPAIAWRRIAGLRDVLAHAYFGIDDDIIWDVVRTEVPALRPQLVGLRTLLVDAAQ